MYIFLYALIYAPFYIVVKDGLRLNLKQENFYIQVRFQGCLQDYWSKPPLERWNNPMNELIWPMSEK